MATVKTAPSKSLSESERPRPRRGAPPPPVLKVTRYDLVSSFMMALVIGLVVAVLYLTLVWLSNRIPQTDDRVDMELIELSGGSEDGAPDETLQVESPEDVTDDPSVTETEDETQVEEMLETVVELSDQASVQAQQQFQADAQSSGKAGSAIGTGRRPLGSGPGDGGGMAREQRWFIRFADGATLDLYAQQLDFFKIELGALLPGKISYISNVSAAKPTVRSATSGAGETRLYMTWRGGSRKRADIELFQKAGINVGNAEIFHFYDRATENRLAILERDYANRNAKEIRRTYFVVQRAGNGFEFVVTNQTYLR
jgi:hypothetical protein